jgi:hypothetical protein
MSEDANSRSNPTLFAEDSLVSHSPKLENSLPKTTPVTSGRKCLDLSGNAGPLGFVEKTLLGSSNWAWTKYSLTWKAKATPQGRLIYQLARLAPRTSDSGSGLLHTPTAKANQTSPSTMARGPGNWVSGLGGAKPHHMVPTPTTMDHVERKSTNKTPSTGKLNYETNKSVSLDRWAKMWPTPTASDHLSNPSEALEAWEKRAEKKKEEGISLQFALRHAAQMWPTPTTPTGGGERSGDRSGTGSLNYMARSGQLTGPKITGSLNPQWVAWLMGYPTEYLSCVPWATRSFRKSRKK